MFSPLLVFFLGLVIQKGATTAISIRQREIEMVCLSIKYNHDTFMWLNAYIAYLLWWMRDGKSAFIIGSMRNPAFFCDDEWVQMSRFRSDAYTSTISAGVPVILLFLTKSSMEFEEETGTWKPLDFSQTNCPLDQGVPYRLFILPKGNSSVKVISISADNDAFSPLRWYIFRHRNLVI